MKKEQMVCKVCGNENINGKIKKCPSCGAKIKHPIYKKWWFWVLIVIGIIIVSSVIEDQPSDEDLIEKPNETIYDLQANNSSNISNTTTYEKVELIQMIDELNSNALKAENKYQNKKIEITGKISNFDSDGSYITIEAVNADDWNFDTIMCYIKNDEQIQFLMDKEKGDIVTIKGKVSSVGEVLGYSVNIDEIS